MRLRLLPITIGVGGLLLVSKSVALIAPYLPGNPAVYEVVVPLAAATETSHPAPPPSASRPPSPAPASAIASKPSDPPPPVISDEERQLLQDLRARRNELEARERTLVEREGVLNAAEQRIVARAAELGALQTKLEQLEKNRVQRDDANWAGLVKVYETMKPRDAAAIFADMDMAVLLQITDRMREAKMAPIFGAMPPDRARLITAQLAAKRSRATTLDHPETTDEGSPRP